MLVAALAEGDVFSLSADDVTDWVVTDVSGYGNGELIVWANGPTPGLSAVFTFPGASSVYAPSPFGGPTVYVK